jgi:hypothetical protein
LELRESENENSRLNQALNVSQPKEFSCDFSEVQEKILLLKDEKIFTVFGCPSTDSMISIFPLVMQEFFLKVAATILLRMHITEKLTDLSETQLHNFINLVENFQQSFLVSLESTVDNSCILYWKLKESFQIFKLKIEKNSCEVGNFLSDFIYKSLHMNRSGKFKEEILENLTLNPCSFSKNSSYPSKYNLSSISFNF